MRKSIKLATLAILLLSLVACSRTQETEDISYEYEQEQTYELETTSVGEEISSSQDYDKNKYQKVSAKRQNIQAQLNKIENKEADIDTFRFIYDTIASCQYHADVEGEWKKTNIHSGLSGTLKISEVTSEGFLVNGELGYFLQTGEFCEQAYFVADDLAIAKYVPEDENLQEQYVLFDFKDDNLKVYSSDDYKNLGFERDVSIHGEYTRDFPVYTNTSVVKNNFTEKELSILHSIMPDDYFYDIFMYTMRNGIVREGKQVEYQGKLKKCLYAEFPGCDEYSYTLYQTKNDEFTVIFNKNMVFSNARDKIYVVEADWPDKLSFDFVLSDISFKWGFEGNLDRYSRIIVDDYIFEWIVSDHEDEWGIFDYDAYLLISKIGEEKPLRYIKAKSSNMGLYKISPDKLFEYKDVDFDGIPDLLLCDAVVPRDDTSSTMYQCFLNRGDSFVWSSQFSEIPDPVIDEKNKVVLGSWKYNDGSQGWTLYKYVDGYIQMSKILRKSHARDENGKKIDDVWVWTINDKEVARSDKNTEKEIEDMFYNDKNEWRINSERWKY